MKLVMMRKSLRIVPENDADRAFLEDTMGICGYTEMGASKIYESACRESYYLELTKTPPKEKTR